MTDERHALLMLGLARSREIEAAQRAAARAAGRRRSAHAGRAWKRAISAEVPTIGAPRREERG